MRLTRDLRTLAFLWLIGATAARADDTRTLPTLETGIQFISGKAESSLTGASAYPIIFRAETQRGTFRPSVATEFLYSAGTTSVTSTATKYTLYGASFVPAYNVFVFREGIFQPFFGFGGVMGWNYFKMTTPPTGVDAYTQGFSYGYEISSGVDISLGRSDGSSMRLRGSMLYLTSRIGGLSTFGLGGFRFVAGFVY